MLTWLKQLLCTHEWGKKEKFYPSQYPSEHHGWLYGWKRTCNRCGEWKQVESDD